MRYRQHDSKKRGWELPDTVEAALYKSFCGQLSEVIDAYLAVPTNADATRRARRALNVLMSVANDLNSHIQQASSRN